MSIVNSLNIDSLKFFTDEGKQILMQKQYSVSWEIKPADIISSAFIRNPKGHFECGLSDNITEDVFAKISKDISLNLYTTDFISLEDYTLYELDVPKNTKILIYTENKSLISNETVTTTEDGVYKLCKNFSSKGVWFKIGFPFEKTASEYDFLSAKKISAKAYTIVDNPGLIQSSVIFNTKSVEPEKGGYNRLLNYKHDTIPEKPDFSLYKPGYRSLPESIFSKEYRLTDIYDIIFFDYEYKVNSSYEPEKITNTILITIIDGRETVSEEYPLSDFFSTTDSKADDSFSNLILSKCNSLDENSPEDNYLYGVTANLFTDVLFCDERTDFDPQEKAYVGKQPSSFYAINANLDETRFPYMRYIGNYWQEKVSTDFIAADTFIIVNDNFNNKVSVSGAARYTYPRIEDNGSELRFHFTFQENSEMFFVSMDDNGEVEKLSDYYPLTYSEKLLSNANGSNPKLENECINTVVGFQTDTEGCYKNVMGIFLIDNKADREYLIGAVNWMSEAEDEDERFRTMFANFGIPDPVTYPNLFKSQNPDEEGTDWKVVNNKSKELFVYYDQIFPYSGTYKALINAMKFLGYQDVIFKEWYRIKDKNDQYRQIALQNYDYKTQKSIPNLLKKYGIDFGQYDRFTKLNRLSMVYHLQRIDEEHSEEELPMFDLNGNPVDFKSFSERYYDSDNIETIIDLYEYRADEVLAKLFAVKQWLERYITGVNCYISDITGEYIVIERLKSQAYLTEYEFKDITKEAYFTPKCKQKEGNIFTDSSAIISCSLNEFNSNALTFEDLKSCRLKDFIRREHTVTDSTGNNLTVYESAPFGAVTIGDEMQFKLELNTDCGSLYEFSKTTDNPILVKENEIVFWNQKLRVSEIDPKELPVIQIKKGNIRSTSGSWSAREAQNSNVLFSIYTVNDYETDQTYCVMTDIKNPDRKIRCKSLVNFSPVYDSNGNTKCYLKYSADNKWELPLFFFSGYKITNEFIGDKYNKNITIHADNLFPETNQEFILEIIEGSIKFVDRKDFGTSEDNNCSSAELVFWEEANEAGTEQRIEMRYEYESERVQLYEFDSDKLSNLNKKNIREIMKSLDSYTKINSETEIPVNRIGEYSVIVTAFDSYNNTYVNKSDKTCKISAAKPDICVIMNKPESDNSTNFYKDNLSYGDQSAAGIISSYDPIKEKLFNRIDDNPIFPITYKIYNDEHRESDGNSIYYDSISYAIDTPKANDYLVLTNMTERANVKSFSTDKIELELKSSNLFKQNIFFVGGEVNICVFDDNLQKPLYSSEKPFVIDKSQILTDSYNNFTGGNLSLLNSNKNNVSDLQKLITDINSNNNINLYIINATECEIIALDRITNWIDSSTGERRTYVPINEHVDKTHGGSGSPVLNENYSDDLYLREFPKDTVVKMSAYHTDKSGIVDIIGECAYRVLDTSVVPYFDKRNPARNDISTCGYVLDGNIDLKHITEAHNVVSLDKNIVPSVLATVNNETIRDTNINSTKNIFGKEDLKFVLKPLNEKAVQYFLRVNGDADEMTYMYDKAGFYGILTQVNYNPLQMMFDSYFDDSYAFSCFKFDPHSLNMVWFKPESESYYTVNNEESGQKDLRDLYMFRNFPVTVLQNSEIVVKTDDDLPTLKGAGTDECVKLWRWKVRAIEDKSNWPEAETRLSEMVLFECINDVLSIKPYMLGSQSIELYCYDKYGNCVKNTGGGNINVVLDGYKDYRDNLERTSFLREM